MDSLDDFICEIQSDELPEELFYEPSDLAEQEHYNSETNYKVGRTAAERRKNDWKYAKRNQAIVDAMGGVDKPLHYYVKTAPEYYYNRYNKTNNKGKHRTAYGNYNAAKNWSPNDKRKLNNCQNQIEELFDEE